MNRLIRNLGLFALAALLHFFAPSAQAQVSCPILQASTTGPTSISVSATTPPGAVLWTGIFNVAATPGYSPTDCTGTWPSTQIVTFDGAQPVVATPPGVWGTVYDSGIPGVGYQLAFSTDTCAGGAGTKWPVTCTYTNRSIANSNTAAHGVQITLIRLATPLSSGTLATIVGQWNVNKGQPSNFIWMQYVLAGAVIVKPTTPTCTVASPGPIAVTLPDVSVAAFGGVGTTAGILQDVPISLTCSGGDPNTSANVYMTLTDATNPTNTSDILSPTAATANTGVGVRIFNNGTPLKYGPDSSVVGNTNQWKVGTVNAGTSTLNIPLTATYVQQAPTVQSGPVAAIATFTLGYN